jgi:hypothetical protein
VKSLCRIKGIGEVLAGRLIEAGLDDCDKIAEAGPEGLGRIRGMNPRAVPAILAQAAALAAPPVPAEGAGVREAAEGLRRKVEAIAAAVHERCAGAEPGRVEQKVEKQLLKLIDLLDRLEADPGRRPGKARRRLEKADRRLAGIEERPAADIARGLKKTRRKLRKSVA